MVDRVLNNVPNMAPDGPLGTEKKGILSAVGDPLGQVLKYPLKPLGHVVGAIGNPNGQALLDVHDHAKEQMTTTEKEKPDKEKPGGQRIGGNAQTGQNPLGL